MGGRGEEGQNQWKEQCAQRMGFTRARTEEEVPVRRLFVTSTLMEADL